jgi:uncharacterized protein
MAPKETQMKWLLPLLLGLATHVLGAQDSQHPTYDAALARKLGADEHGMKMYALVLLKIGPRNDLSKEETASAFAGHMANINRLAAGGQLVFAGPLDKNERYRGIFVFNVATIEEANALLATDPAVKAGALAGEVYLMYGSAALQEVTALHHRISPD